MAYVAPSWSPAAGQKYMPSNWTVNDFFNAGSVTGFDGKPVYRYGGEWDGSGDVGQWKVAPTETNDRNLYINSPSVQYGGMTPLAYISQFVADPLNNLNAPIPGVRNSSGDMGEMFDKAVMSAVGMGLGAAVGGTSLLGTARSVAGGLNSDNWFGAGLGAVTGGLGGLSGVGGVGDASWGVNDATSGGNMFEFGDWMDGMTGGADWAGDPGFTNPYLDDNWWGGADGLDMNVPGAGTGVGGVTGPDFSGDSGGILDSIGSVLKSGGTAAAGLISKLFAPTNEGGFGFDGKTIAALLGAVIGGTQGKAADQQVITKPWNEQYWGAPQDAATNLMNTNTLNQPNIPTLPGLPDLANQDQLNAAIQAAIRPVRQNFYDPGGTASQIRTEFGDQYGSSRNQLALGVASGRLAQTEADIASKMTSDLYRTNLAYNQDRAMQDILNSQWTFGQQTNQADKAFTAPWTNVTNAANVFSAASGKGSIQTTPMPSTPWWQTAAGGALTGIDAYNKIFGKA